MAESNEKLATAKADDKNSVTKVVVPVVCDAVLPEDPTIRAVALTVYAEAAGSLFGGNDEEKRAIADAIYNRTMWKEFKETTALALLTNKYNQIQGFRNPKYRAAENSDLCRGKKGCSVRTECADLKAAIRAAEAAALGSKYHFHFWQSNNLKGGTKIGGTYFRDYFVEGRPTRRELTSTGVRDGKPFKPEEGK